MPVVEISTEVVDRLVLASLQTTLSTTAVLMAHEDDPIGGGAFVRLHACVEAPRTGRPNDADTRAVMVRATAQVPASSLRADGYALHALADTLKNALAGKTLSGESHRLVFGGGAVTRHQADGPALGMRDAQVTWTAMAERL